MLCNSTVNEKVRRVLQTKALAPVKLKGKTHPTQVFQVTGMKSRNSMLTTSRGGIGDVSLSTSQLARVRRTLILKFGAACDVILRGDGPVTAASPPGSPSPTPAGRRRVVVVRGIIGTGKTAMIPALLRVLANKDITTLVGSEIVVIKGVGVNAGQGISREASSSPFSAWRHTVKIVEERYMLNLLKYYKKNHKEDYAQLAEWFSVLIEWRGSAQSDFELLSELYEAKTAAARESAQNDGAVDGAGAGAGAAGNGRPKRESFFKRIGSMLTDAKEPSAAERLDLVKHSVRTRVGDLISQIYGHDAAKQKLVDKTRRDGLFSALRGIVGALDRLMRSEKKQLAIVLEDFHKFDVHSRRLFFDLPHSRHVHTIITSRPMIPFIKAQFDDAGIEPIFVDIGEIPESDSTGLIWGALNTDSKSPLIKHLAKMGEGNPLLIAQWCAQAREQKLIDEYGVEVVAADPATLRMPPNLRHYYLALYDALGPTKQGILRLLTLSKCDLSSKQIRECIDSKGRRNAQIYQNHCQVLEKMKILTRYHRRAEEVNGSAKASAAGGTKTGARTRTPPPAPPRRGSTVIPTTSQRRAGGPPPPPRRRRRQSLRAATAIVVSYQLKSQNLRMVIRDMLLDKQKDSIEKKLQEVVPESHPLPGKEVKPHHRRRTMPLHSISQEIEL